MESKVSLWHRRLSHVHLKALFEIANKRIIKDLPEIKGNIQDVCVECRLEKRLEPHTNDLIRSIPRGFLNLCTWI